MSNLAGIPQFTLMSYTGRCIGTLSIYRIQIVWMNLQLFRNLLAMCSARSIDATFSTTYLMVTCGGATSSTNFFTLTTSQKSPDASPSNPCRPARTDERSVHGKPAQRCISRRRTYFRSQDSISSLFMVLTTPICSAWGHLLLLTRCAGLRMSKSRMPCGINPITDRSSALHRLSH